jgi:hypothetical protein
MVQPNNPNFLQLARAVEKLTPLLKEIVFLGGCVTGLLITDLAVAPVRPTLDIDAIIEISTYVEFMAIENRLRQLGFHQSPGEAVPICRWFTDDVILDLMPTDPTILGFSNRWYKPAMRNSQRIKIGELNVRMITAPYFLATKLEAFHARGNSDFGLSRDMEDIITVIDGRPELVEEVSLSESEVREYLSNEFSGLLSNRVFHDALPG